MPESYPPGFQLGDAHGKKLKRKCRQGRHEVPSPFPPSLHVHGRFIFKCTVVQISPWTITKSAFRLAYVSRFRDFLKTNPGHTGIELTAARDFIEKNGPSPCRGFLVIFPQYHRQHKDVYADRAFAPKAAPGTKTKCPNATKTGHFILGGIYMDAIPTAEKIIYLSGVPFFGSSGYPIKRLTMYIYADTKHQTQSPCGIIRAGFQICGMDMQT